MQYDSSLNANVPSSQISNGEPERPLIVHVGRLGAEKNLEFFRRYCSSMPMQNNCLHILETTASFLPHGLPLSLVIVVIQ